MHYAATNSGSDDTLDSLKQNTAAKIVPVKRKLVGVDRAPSNKRSKTEISDSDDSLVQVISVISY